MKLKPLLNKYTRLYELSEKISSKEKENQLEVSKLLFTDNNSLDENYDFYILELYQDDREWKSSICLSLSEATALKSEYTHIRYKKKRWELNLKSKIHANIKKLTIKSILKDEELLKSFIKRIKLIVPYDMHEIEKIPNELKVKIFWNFSSHLEPQYIYYDGKDFLYSTHKDAKIPSSINYGYSYVINDEGKYGVIKNKTKLLAGIPEFEVILEDENYYINIDSTLAEVQKNKPKDSDDYKDYLCNIVDIDIKKVYNLNALCNSLDYDNFIIITEDKKLQYIKIDTKEHKIENYSKKYDYIINPIHYAPKPVYDKSSNLWGYINNKCEEIVSPKFKDYGSFNWGYAVIKEDSKYIVIDKKGNEVINKKDHIHHYEDAVFFVKEKEKYAIYTKDKIYIDFFDIKEEIEELKKEEKFDDKGLIKYLQRQYRKKTLLFTRENNSYYLYLSLKIVDKKIELRKKIFELSLSEYIKLFDVFSSEKDLSQSGLLGRIVTVKKCEIINKYKNIIDEESKGIIGWKYPNNANSFDMSVELPIEFSKKDGKDLTLGIKFEYLELLEKKIN